MNEIYSGLNPTRARATPRGRKRGNELDGMDRDPIRGVLRRAMYRVVRRFFVFTARSIAARTFPAELIDTIEPAHQEQPVRVTLLRLARRSLAR